MTKNRFRFILLFILFVPFQFVRAQDVVHSWQAYSSLRTVTHVALDNQGTLWCTTTGGLFSFKDGKMQSHFTTIDGMYNVNPSAMAYDSTHNGIWMGYSDGTIEFFNIKKQSFSQYKDIYRATRYNPRGINMMKMRGDTLFIATDFGVVLFDTNNDLVLDTYSNLGSFESGVAVNTIAFDSTNIYCGTTQGIAVGNLVKDELVVPSNWKNYDGTNGYSSTSTTAIGYFNGTLYATTSNGTNYQFNGKSWSHSAIFTGEGITRYKRTDNGNRFLAIDPGKIYVLTKSSMKSIGISKGIPLISASFTKAGNTNSMVVGTSTEGLALINDYNQQKVDNYFSPNGPYLNLFNGLNVDNGVLISGSSQVPGGGVSNISSTGFYIFKGGTWYNYNNETTSLLKQQGINSIFKSAYNDSSYYFGSWGKGIVEQNKKTGKITIYNTANGLEGVPQNNQFIVISGLDKDKEGNMWATSYLAPNTPLFYHKQGSDKWVGLRHSPAVSSSDAYFGLMVDSYNQKWISLQTVDGNGDGILVLDTNNTPTNTGDDKAYHLTTNINQGFLPDMKVNTMVEDKEGDVWVGTDRGVVRYLFPDRIIGGTANDRRAEFLRKTNSDSLLLRDSHVNCIAVDAANRKWIGSENGVWLVSANGDSVIKHFTTENSPLISNDILSLAVDNKTGTVFIATDKGLVSYVSVVKQARPAMKHLFIYPNPYSYSRETGPIIISKLSSQTTIRIMTIDGHLVNKIQARGGRAEWDARDFNGNKLPTGVYLVVALDKQNNEKGVGKVVIVR